MTTRQYKIDRHACPLCYGGELWERCDKCGGSGRFPQPPDWINGLRDCDRCEGAGEVVTRKCDLCDKGFVTAALMRLAEAEKYVRSQEPEWSGKNADHDGVTVYSMAEWFRRRAGAPPILRAWGGIVAEEAHVLLITEEGRPPWITFTGFAWGYGGEGPSGLAAVLTDAGFFASLDEAQVWVARQDFGGSWELSR